MYNSIDSLQYVYKDFLSVIAGMLLQLPLIQALDSITKDFLSALSIGDQPSMLSNANIAQVLYAHKHGYLECEREIT